MIEVKIFCSLSLREQRKVTDVLSFVTVNMGGPYVLRCDTREQMEKYVCGDGGGGPCSGLNSRVPFAVSARFPRIMTVSHAAYQIVPAGLVVLVYQLL